MSVAHLREILGRVETCHCEKPTDEHGYCHRIKSTRFDELVEKDPTGRSQHEPGAKMDLGKPPVRRGLLEYFPRACIAVANISKFGSTKYAWKGWETVPDGIDRYGDAEARHICFAAIEGPITADSKMLHAAHEAWNALARLELICREIEKELEGVDRG